MEPPVTVTDSRDTVNAGSKLLAGRLPAHCLLYTSDAADEERLV